MAASDMMSALMELCQDKHIDQLYLIDRLEQSLAKSYAEILHLDWGAKVTIDRTTGKIYVYRLEPIDDSMDEEGNFTEFEEIDVTPKNTSRIAAQHAKAEINAIVRNSAREQIYEEFSGRIGDLISGTVLQSTPDFTIVKIREGVEAELPHFDQRRYENERNERPMGERYLHNQHIKAVIIDVRDPNSNLQPVRGEHSRPPIVISRTHPELMRRLFEQEVPEIYEGTVQIKSIAREPRPALQGRRPLARRPSGSRGRLRRPQGQPCSRCRGRAPWRARRRHPVGCRSCRLRRQRPVAR